VRLGDGTAESHRRIAAALADLWRFTGEMFAVDDAERSLIEAGIIIDPASLRETWRSNVARVLEQATLSMPAEGWAQNGGRQGRHTEHFGHLLAELQYVQRAYPGASW
jgi:ring-1,2-phenylacetyl-CoA epoxidase subunit PaaC